MNDHRQVKYQVFISSTYRDLREARVAVSWAVLRLDHIPAGMEVFPATNDRGWGVIERTIDHSDFVVLILGSLYGSIDEQLGISWTEREYTYAHSLGKPVLAFVRRRDATPGNFVETSSTAIKRLERFTRTVMGRHLVKEWSTAEELETKVTQALFHAISAEERTPSPPLGWVRGGGIAPPNRTPNRRTLAARSLLAIHPIAVVDYQALPPSSFHGLLAERGEQAIKVEMGSIPFGRISTNTEGVPHHDLRGETPAGAAVTIRRSEIQAEIPDPDDARVLHVHLRGPLTYTSTGWRVT